MKYNALALVISLSLSACATVESGNNFDPAVASQFKTGVTTRAEVEATLGKAQSVNTSADGSSQLIYVHVVSKGNAMTGNSGATGNTAAFVFNKDGVLQRTSFQDIQSRIR